MKRKIIIIGILLVILVGFILSNTSMANEETVNIYATHRFGNLLERDRIDLTCIYMVQKMNGEENPAYCLNYGRDGATENFSYNVTVNKQITDMQLWRTVINGYPYKTPEELGCETKEEAYLATRHAIYCTLYNRDPESYHSLGGAAGERTLAALKNIVNTAKTSNEVKVSPSITINETNNLWMMDNIEKEYVSKEFTVSANALMKEYYIILDGENIDGTKITDMDNNEKSTFKNNEKFKILIPLKNLTKDGSFSILASGKVFTKPVYYGDSNNESLQNIAITGTFYEDGTGIKTEYYLKNKTKIKILKQDQESKEILESVKFQILDENKEIIFSDLATNEEGLIEVENLIPGKYYIKETETKEGYIVYDDLIEINLKLNEENTVTVNNLKVQENPEVEEIKTELEIEQVKAEQEVIQELIKLPKTGM